MSFAVKLRALKSQGKKVQISEIYIFNKNI